MPHDCRPRCLQRTRTTHRVSPPPPSPDAWHAPPPACCPCLHAPRGLSSPCVLSPDPVTTPGCPVLGECVRGGARPHCHRTPRGLHPPCVLSPDPVTTPGRPVLGGCVRGGRQTALPRRVVGCVPPRPSHRRAAATTSTHTHRAPSRRRTGRPPARPGARAGRTGALARPAPRGRRADTRTGVATQARTGRRATWTAHGDYLSVLASTRTSCQSRHRRARVAPATATRHIISHRP